MIKLKERRVLFGTPEETDEEIQNLLDDIDKKDKEEAEEERIRRKQELEDANHKPVPIQSFHHHSD